MELLQSYKRQFVDAKKLSSKLLARPFGLVSLQSTFQNDQSTISDPCDNARICLGEVSASRKYFLFNLDELYEQTTRWSCFRIKLQIKPLVFSVFGLLNIQMSCKLGVTCVLHNIDFCLFQDNVENFSAFNSNILPFYCSTFGQLWNISVSLAFLVGIISA